MTTIPKSLHEHINTAYPAHVCLIGTTLPGGYAQITPRGSTMVFDDEHFALWERGRGSTNANLADGTKVTVFFRKPPLREFGLLPRGGIARFYGTAKIYKSGPIYEEIWKRLIEPEKKAIREDGLRRARQGGASRRLERHPTYNLTSPAIRSQPVSVARQRVGCGVATPISSVALSVEGILLHD